MYLSWRMAYGGFGPKGAYQQEGLAEAHTHIRLPPSRMQVREEGVDARVPGGTRGRVTSRL